MQYRPTLKILFIFFSVYQFCFLAIAENAYVQETFLQSSIQKARGNGEMDLADKLAAELLFLANQSNSGKWQAEALYEKARNSMERNQYEDSLSLLNESIELFQSVGERKRLGDAYRQLGVTYRYQSNYPTALEYIYLAMQIYQELEDKSAISSAYNSIGIVMEMMGQLEEASEAHNNALQLHYELNNQQGIASALYNLGDIYRSMNDFDRALPYLLDALKMDTAAGDPKYMAYSHNKLGYMYIQMGMLGKSREHLEQALALFQQIQAPRDIDWAWSSIARLEFNEGNFELAQEIISGVIERAKANKYNSLLVDAYKVAVLIANAQENYDKALDFIDKGAEQAIANKEILDHSRFEEFRVEALIGKNELRQALEALKKQNAIEDEVLDSKRIDTIARIQAQADFVQQAQHIKLLENEKKLQQATLEREQLSSRLWLLVAIGSSLLIFLFYTRVNQRRLNIKLSEEVKARTIQLEEKNAELSKAYKQMENISMTDKLTGINNRRFLENSIERDLSQTARCYENWYTGQGDKPIDEDIIFFLIDLDDFKDINDNHGHTVGDQVLQQLVQRMANVFRQSDYLVRWGGEEFIAVARFIDRKEAPNLARRMVDEVRKKPFVLSPNAVTTLTCSVGYSCFYGAHDRENLNWQKLFVIADSCAYVVKYSGKNGWLGVEEVNSESYASLEFSPETIKTLSQQELLILRSSIAENQLNWAAN